MGFISDLLFGTDDEVHTETRSTLGPEQEKLMRQLQQLLSSNPDFDPSKTPTFEGEMSPGESPLQSMSLQALEQQVLNGVDTESDFQRSAMNTVMQMLSGQGQQQPGEFSPSGTAFDTAQELFNSTDFTGATDQYFTDTIRDPMLRDFQETVLPGIGRNYSSNFFSSDRQRADRFAQRDLTDSLVQERGRLGVTAAEMRQRQLEGMLGAKESDLGREFGAFQTREDSRIALGDQDLRRRLGALDAAPRVASIDSNQRTSEIDNLLATLGAGGVQRDIQRENMLGEFTRFESDEARRQQRLQSLLQSLGLQTSENIAEVKGGREGIIGELIQAAATMYAN